MRMLHVAVRTAAALGLLGAFAAAHGVPISRTGNGDAPEAASAAKKAKALEAYSRIPMHFEANAGQFQGAVRFATRGSGYRLHMTGKETVLALQRPSDPKVRGEAMRKAKSKAELARALAAPKEAPTVIGKSFAGANPNSEVVGEDLLPGKSHYLVGKDPSRWRKNVPHYGKVRYRDVYPGIDLVYYGREGRLEYDWIVAPGADPRRIVEVIRGATGLRIAASGDLAVDTKDGPVWQKKPVMYQEVNGQRVAVEGGYVTAGPDGFGFKVGRYDETLPLVIDPVLDYSTFLGGSFADGANAIAVSPSGEAYVTGTTESADFPHQPTDAMPADQFGHGLVTFTFVTKFNAAGNGIEYSTYFGGSFSRGNGIAVGTDGSAYVTGDTFGNDFPATTTLGDPAATFQSFVVKLAPSGSSMAYSTVLGPAQSHSIAVDAAGSAFVGGGEAGTGGFPTTVGAFQTTASGGGDAFLAKLTPDGHGLVYATLFGAPDGFAEITGVALDSAGNAYVTGRTDAPSLPLANPYQPVKGLDQDGFVAKFDATGSSLVYSTFLGGDGLDQLFGIAVDNQGSAWVTGLTTCVCFPVVNPLRNDAPDPNAQSLALVAKLNPSGAVAFATLLGGDSQGTAIAVDRQGSAFVTGHTSATAVFPLVNDLGLGSDPQSGQLRGSMAFLSKISADGSSFGYSMIIGAYGIRPGDPRFDINDFVKGGSVFTNGIAVDPSGGAYVAGVTQSSDFPTFNAIQPRLNQPLGGDGFPLAIAQDAFVFKISDAIGGIGLFSTKNPSTVGDVVTFTATLPDAAATGSVTFFDGGNPLGVAPLSSGVAKLSTSSLSVATHSITAQYNGDATHPAAASAVLIQDVLDVGAQRASTSTAVSAVGNPDHSVTLTAVVTGASPTGIVEFLDTVTQQPALPPIAGGTLSVRTDKYVGVLSSGAASVRYSPAPGTHSITAFYVGDVRNLPSSSAEQSFLVGPPVVTFGSPADGSQFQVPATVTVNIGVTAQVGASVASVTLLVNGTPFGTLTTPPYTFTWTASAPGLYVLGGQATDSLGQTSEVATERVLVFDPGMTFYHHDLQGNVIAASDGLAQIAYTETYRPYGDRVVASPAGAVAQTHGNRLWFHGKPQDEATGLQYFGARYYDPVVGRFMGVDEAGFDENNLQSCNLYAYGNNNPYRYRDPDGRMGELAIGVLVTVGAIVVATVYVANCKTCMKNLQDLGKLITGPFRNQADNPNESSGDKVEAPKPEPNGTNNEGNDNPYKGPVDKPVIVVDPHGNAIPVEKGERITSSPNGEYQQVRGADGRPTGLRLDRGGHKNQPDPAARDPHAHVPGVTTPEGNPHLPAKGPKPD